VNVPTKGLALLALLACAASCSILLDAKVAQLDPDAKPPEGDADGDGDADSAPVCGDGALDPGEACDDGARNADAPDACRLDCTQPRCGDGITDEGEECDDGNVVDDDVCSNGCLPVVADLCMTCESDEECGRDVDLCSTLADGRYCTMACEAGACPEGFECEELTRLDGSFVNQCVPPDRSCTGCVDLDGDSYGLGTACHGPDCDDAEATINPEAEERCDGVDSNCSGDESDATDLQTVYYDADGDGVGDSLTSRLGCPGGGMVTVGGDCDDANPAVAPGVAEACDGVDNNCGDGVDEGCEGTCSAPIHLDTPPRGGSTSRDDTTAGQFDRYAASCGGDGSPDRVYEVDLDADAYYTFETDLRDGGLDTILSVRSSCDDVSSEVGCDDDEVSWTRESRIDSWLRAGTYFVFVDGYSGHGWAEGAYTLVIRRSW
jgi:cysteine-rich repeat protein